MKPEEHAWRALNAHAAAQLPAGFADRVLRIAHGPSTESWRQLQAHAAAQLRLHTVSRSSWGIRAAGTRV